MTVFIWVPGTEQPTELEKFASPLTSSARNVLKYGGRDYYLETAQEAFDASEVLRRAGLPYNLEMRTGKPWRKNSREFLDCW